MTNILQLSKEDLREELRDAIKDILEEIQSNEPEQSPETGGVALACEVLKRSKSWVYKATMDNKIPFKKFGNSVVFDRAELEAWLQEHTKNPEQERNEKITDTLRKSANKKLINR
jgi:excisionase family DNA binding protein